MCSLTTQLDDLTFADDIDILLKIPGHSTKDTNIK